MTSEIGSGTRRVTVYVLGAIAIEWGLRIVAFVNGDGTRWLLLGGVALLTWCALCTAFEAHARRRPFWAFVRETWTPKRRQKPPS